MASNKIDRNALSNDRLRRAMQRLSQGAATGTIKVSAPLSNNGSTVGLNFATSTGLALIAGSTLGILFANNSIVGSASGIQTGSTIVSTSRQVLTSAPLSGGGDLSADRTISIPQATSTANGYLTSTDWTTFNSKQPSGNYLAGSTALATTAPITGGGNLSTGLTIGITQAGSTTNGYLSSTDWNKFNSTGGGSSTTVYALDASISTLTSTSSTGVGVQKSDASLYLKMNPSGGSTVLVNENFRYADGALSAVDSGNWRTMQNAVQPGLNSSSTSTAWNIQSSTAISFATINGDVTATYAGGTALNLANGYTVTMTINTQNTSATGSQGTGPIVAVNSTTFTNSGNQVWVTLNRSHVALFQGNATLKGSTAFGTQLSAGNHTLALTVDSTGTIATVSVDGTLYLSTGSISAPASADKLVGFLTTNGTDSISNWQISVPTQMTGLAVQNDPNSGISTCAAGLQSRLIFINTADSGTLTNITTATGFSQSTVLPAAFFEPGKTIRIVAGGQITTNAAQQVTVALTVGGLGIQMPNFTVGSGASTLIWQIELITVCRASGSGANNFHQTFEGVIQQSGTVTSTNFSAGNQLTTLNTGATQAIQANFAATVGNNTAFLRHLSVEVWN